MYFNIGKIVDYENKKGIILTKDNEKYMFLEKDLNTDIKINDIVIFRPEIIDNVKRAYFVKNINKYLEEDTNKNNIKKYLKSIIKEG